MTFVHDVKHMLYLLAFVYYICYLQGSGPTVVRAMVVNAAQLATYSQAKQYLLYTGKYSQTCKQRIAPKPNL